VVDEMEAAQQPCIRTVDGTAVATAGNGEPWFRAKPKWVRDANLIAAAPELLEALEALYRRHSDTLDRVAGIDVADELIAARAAIAKARGMT
jgi:hypothetical protein